MSIQKEIFADQDKKADNLFQKKIIYVVDDDAQVRKSLYFMLSCPSKEVRPFGTAQDFLEQIDFLNPAPILLDIRMADIDGLQLLEILKQRAVLWPVIILTAHGDVGVAVSAMKLGAIEFLEKPFDPEALDHAIDQAFRLLDQSEHMLSERDQARYLIGNLTARESEVMAILMEGVSNKEVAHRLGLSVRTVEMHRAHAMTKLKVKSIVEVVRLADVGGFTPEMRLRLEGLGGK